MRSLSSLGEFVRSAPLPANRCCRCKDRNSANAHDSSLRNNMFELASRLVGVYKVNHMTKSVTVENRDYIVKQRKVKEEQDKAKVRVQAQLQTQSQASSQQSMLASS